MTLPAEEGEVRVEKKRAEKDQTAKQHTPTSDEEAGMLAKMTRGRAHTKTQRKEEKKGDI